MLIKFLSKIGYTGSHEVESSDCSFTGEVEGIILKI